MMGLRDRMDDAEYSLVLSTKEPEGNTSQGERVSFVRDSDSDSLKNL